MDAEASKRRPNFRDGSKIRLADGQMWTLPAPPTASELKAGLFGTEYSALIDAVMEADTESDRSLAELSFAILLLGHNYCLSAVDYRRVLGFDRASPQLTEWQLALRRVTDEHLASIRADLGNRLANPGLLATPDRFTRLRVWLRNLLPSRWRGSIISERD